MTTPTTKDVKSGRWPVWKLALCVYPPVMGAAAVNIFFLSLMLQRFGMVAFTPVFSVVTGIILGIPLAWIGGMWFHRVIAEAEGEE